MAKATVQVVFKCKYEIDTTSGGYPSHFSLSECVGMDKDMFEKGELSIEEIAMADENPSIELTIIEAE